MEQILQCVKLWYLCSHFEPAHVLEKSPTASYFLSSWLIEMYPQFNLLWENMPLKAQIPVIYPYVPKDFVVFLCHLWERQSMY